jgi:hypothetical protein
MKVATSSSNRPVAKPHGEGAKAALPHNTKANNCDWKLSVYWPTARKWGYKARTTIDSEWIDEAMKRRMAAFLEFPKRGRGRARTYLADRLGERPLGLSG